MIEVVFYKTKDEFLRGFLFSGHAGFSEKGKDIVCAGISSAVMMCCNGITEILKEKALVNCEEGKVYFETFSKDRMVQAFLEALRLQVSLLKERYEKNIDLKIMEDK